MPSVRVRKSAYSTLRDGDRRVASEAVASQNGGSAASRMQSPRARSRTLMSIFGSSQPAGPEDVGGPSTSTGAGGIPSPEVVITPDQIDDDAGYQRDDEEDTPAAPRSYIRETISRRRASNATSQALGVDAGSPRKNSTVGRRGRGISVSESAAGNRGVADDHLTVPNSPEQDEVPLGRHRNSSMVSVYGGRGTSIGIQIPDRDLRGSVASAMGVNSEGRTSRQGRDEEVGEEEEAPEEASDYTTDGSDYDDEEHHLDEVVDHLDVIDPEVAMISHLSNTANSILVPRLPMLYSRRPVVTLPTLTPSDTMESLISTGSGDGPEKHKKHRIPRRHHKNEDELDAHVAHVLKRRAKIRRAARGLWAFVKTPTGIVAAIYGFAVVFWGAAIVLFLLKWINVHNDNTQKFWIEISSQVVNALFTVTGVGLIPWRVMDTYRIVRIWHFKRLDRKLRREKSLPALEDEDDLPDPLLNPNFTHVLTEKQQRELALQQKRFTKSQTWYRAHATDTHRAFPIGTALIICLWVDANSVFQCMLCGTMWGLDRYTRPPWTTGILIPASFLCGIAAGVFIARGGNKTKKVAEVEDRLRKALAQGHKDRADANGVYARRAGLVGIIPMPADDDEEPANGTRQNGSLESTEKPAENGRADVHTRRA